MVAILGMRRREIRGEFDRIVAFAEIERFIDTPIKYYSSGMQVRLGFSVAAHVDPEILLVDEVLAVGDVAFQTKCLNKLAELTEQEKTIVLVSHNMASIVQHSRKVLWLRAAGAVVRVEAWSSFSCVDARAPGDRESLEAVKAICESDRSSRSLRLALRRDGTGLRFRAKSCLLRSLYRPARCPVFEVTINDAPGISSGAMTTTVEGTRSQLCAFFATSATGPLIS